MKKAVMYGAGNIGRGFIGKTFSQSGYDVCFVDIDTGVVGKLNEDRCYPVKIVSNDGYKEEIVTDVRAVDGMDIDAVAKEIENADIMATAVGVNVLPKIVKPICAGLKKRFDANGAPLNVIICENMLDADQYIRKLIEEEMGAEYKTVLDQKLGLIEASIGRMVPVMTDEMREGNALMVWVEPHDELPVDKAAFVGEILDLKGLIPYTPFGYYIKRKLFIHNMGHVMCAYLGWLKGYEYIHECVADEDIRAQTLAAMAETAAALNKEYGVSLQELDKHIEDLLYRFANKALGDTVARVGRDPLRKLGNNDRLIGAALFCIEQNIMPNNIIKGIAAGFSYDNTEDESAVKMQRLIKNRGIGKILKSHCELSEDMTLFEKIIVESAGNCMVS